MDGPLAVFLRENWFKKEPIKAIQKVLIDRLESKEELGGGDRKAIEKLSDLLGYHIKNMGWID